DGRTTKECDYLNKVIGKDALSAYTANISFTGFTAPKILWVENQEPENFARIKKIMLPKDYLAYKLTGVHCTDVSDASGMLLLDVKNRKWSKEMCDICHIKEEMLPKLYESYECVGTVLPEIASELGIPTTVKVAAGAGDNAAAAVATGTVGDGNCNISLGTSGTIFVSSKKFGVDKNNALHAFCDANGAYHLMGCMLSAASCNKWWMDDIIGTKDYAAEQQLIDQLGENHVFYLPYLMGERSPHNNPNARATFIGMTMDTTRTDMTQAVLEGVAFAIRDSYEVAKSLGIPITRTKICGGGAKSPLWKKIMANVLGIEVDVLEAEEGPALGGAMLAAVACGAFENVEAAVAKIVKVVDTIKPDPELTAKYEEKYQQFKQIYPALVPVFEKII
ncbi:MAG: xylulokinase, partial [Agathobacter sp.]